MGGGRWSTDVYKERDRARRASGKSAFAYSDRMKRSGSLKAHPTLDPYGVTVRESRDSDEHPASNAIGVLFDVTGSMGQIPKELREYLPQLLGLLLYKNYIPHPQILFGAVGDANSDRVPLQIGQFESDNRMDEHLQNLILEGGGGGQGRETYGLGMYFMAQHTAIDCYEKRDTKGYLFMIGDEMAYPAVRKDQVAQLIGGGLQQDMPLEEVVKLVKQKYNLFFIVPNKGSRGRNHRIYDFWKDTLGEQHVIPLEDPANIAETIALTIGMNEGTIGLDDGIDDLREMGVDDTKLEGVSRALATHPTSKGGGSIVKGSGGLAGLDDDDDGDGGSRRL